MKRFTLLALVLLVLSVPAFAEDKSGSSENYRDFTTLEDAKAQAEKGPTVLFFYAKWCPSCRSSEKEIKANLDKLGEIVIFKVDYDNSTKLKRMFGVSYQDTFVQIDKNGKKLVLWNGGALNKILSKVRR